MTRYILLLCALVVPMHAVTIGQPDTFEDGTTMGWFVPGAHPFPPTNIATGGPGGVDDNYLQLTATGDPGAAGGRMAVLNGSQWQGNYLAAGVVYITMYVNNFGPEELHLRLLFEDFPDAPMMPPDNLALSAEAVIVPAGSGWQQIIFPVVPSALVSGGLGTVTGALTDVDIIRLFHNPLPEFGGPNAGPAPVSAVLGVDDITAAVPEPSTWFLGVAGIALLLAGNLRAVVRRP